MSDAASLRSRLGAILQGRTRVVLSVAVVVWGLTLFDLTLLPRKPVSYLPVYPPQRLVGANITPRTTILTGDSFTKPDGPWLIEPEGDGVRVTGTDLASVHVRKRHYRDRFAPRLRTTVPVASGAIPIDIAAWRGDKPALFAISSPQRNPAIDIYSLRGEPRQLLSIGLPLPPQSADRRNFALARWSGPLPDLYVIDRNTQRHKPLTELSEQPWSVRIYSGESNFQKLILHTQIRTGISRRLNKYEWWVDVGPRHREKPDIVLVSRGRRTSSKRTEIHLLSGEKRYRDFSVHAATVLPQRVGLSREFVFQSDRQGGAVLLLKREPDGELVVRALPLP